MTIQRSRSEWLVGVKRLYTEEHCSRRYWPTRYKSQLLTTLTRWTWCNCMCDLSRPAAQQASIQFTIQRRSNSIIQSSLYRLYLSHHVTSLLSSILLKNATLAHTVLSLQPQPQPHSILRYNAMEHCIFVMCLALLFLPLHDDSLVPFHGRR